MQQGSQQQSALGFDSCVPSSPSLQELACGSQPHPTDPLILPYMATAPRQTQRFHSWSP